MMTIDQAALRRALHGPDTSEHAVRFEMECRVEFIGMGEPNIQLPYRAWFVSSYSDQQRAFAATVRRIEENVGTIGSPQWVADAMPRVARLELERLIARALNEQDAIDADREIEEELEYDAPYVWEPQV